MRKDKFLFFRVIVCLFIISGCRDNFLQISVNRKNINISQAIEIGKKELRRLGYIGLDENIIVKADDENSIWNKHILLLPSILEREDVKTMNLNNNPYWAIYYALKSGGKGGDAFVFIMRSNGKVMGAILGE